MISVSHTCRLTPKRAVGVINKLRRRPVLLMTPRIPPPALRSSTRTTVVDGYQILGSNAFEQKTSRSVEIRKTQSSPTSPAYGALVGGGVIPSEFHQVLWQQKTGVLGAIVRRCLGDLNFSCLDRTATCDGQTDGQTNTKPQHIPRYQSDVRVKWC